MRGAPAKTVVVGAEILKLHAGVNPPMLVELVVGARADIIAPEQAGVVAAAGGGAGAAAAGQSEGLLPRFVGVDEAKGEAAGQRDGGDGSAGFVDRDDADGSSGGDESG